MGGGLGLGVLGTMLHVRHGIMALLFSTKELKKALSEERFAYFMLTGDIAEQFSSSRNNFIIANISPEAGPVAPHKTEIYFLDTIFQSRSSLPICMQYLQYLQYLQFPCSFNSIKFLLLFGCDWWAILNYM